MNKLDPSLVKTPWKPKEDLMILEVQQKKGNKWAKIAAKLPGRTENAVKNRFKSILKKARLKFPQSKNVIASAIEDKRAAAAVYTSTELP
jgi:myb proto-oncogene protein